MVIEVWGNTPEILQDVIDSMIFPLEVKKVSSDEIRQRPFFQRSTDRFNKLGKLFMIY